MLEARPTSGYAGSKLREATMATAQVTGRGKWMALTAALLGWMFDGLEMGLFPVTARSAFLDLGIPEADYPRWLGIVTAFFLVGAATGGVLFGRLVIDNIHQVRGVFLDIGLSTDWVDYLVTPENKGWRLLMMVGAVPALLTLFIRLFVPESARWEKERARGATSHWANRDLVAV